MGEGEIDGALLGESALLAVAQLEALMQAEADCEGVTELLEDGQGESVALTVPVKQLEGDAVEEAEALRPDDALALPQGDALPVAHSVLLVDNEADTLRQLEAHDVGELTSAGVAEPTREGEGWPVLLPPPPVPADAVNDTLPVTEPQLEAVRLAEGQALLLPVLQELAHPEALPLPVPLAHTVALCEGVAVAQRDADTVAQPVPLPQAVDDTEAQRLGDAEAE